MERNNKLKVLLVSPYSAKRTGGIGTWSKIVLDHSENVSNISLKFLNTSQGLPKRWSMSNKVFHIIIGGLDSILILFRLFWNMFEFRPDVVHYTSSASSALYKDLMAIWIVKYVFKRRFIIHWHFGGIPTIINTRSKDYNLFTKVCKKSNVSITLNEKSNNALKKEGLNTVYIPNPIPISLQEEAEHLIIDETNINRNIGEVLFVGHIYKEKGVVELVKACSECNEVKKLIMVGPIFEEQLEKELLEIAQKRDNGSWLNLVGEKDRLAVWNYYKKCNIFCLPSYSEGFPYVILEAMAFSCPVVATKVGAMPEMLAGDCGCLIDDKKVEPLKQAIKELISNPNFAYNMGKNAHGKVLEHYTIESVFRQYYDVWLNNNNNGIVADLQ